MTADTVPATIMLIIDSAFNGQAATGGFAGSTVMMAMRYGVARGLFSNESGLGRALCCNKLKLCSLTLPLGIP